MLLAGKIEWQWIDSEIAPLYSDKGRPGIETRFVIGLLLLKYIYGLSDEGVCERWVDDPYFQHFTGEEFFQLERSHIRARQITVGRDIFVGQLIQQMADPARHQHRQNGRRHHKDNEPQGDTDDLSSDRLAEHGFGFRQLE